MSGVTRCRVCGRVIRVSPWVERGIGPDCYAALKRKGAVDISESDTPEYLHTFTIYQIGLKIGTFKTNAITRTDGREAAPVSAKGLLHVDVETAAVEEGGFEMRGYMGDPETSPLVRITGVVFKDYNWEDPIVTDMEALTLEAIVNPETHPQLYGEKEVEAE